VIRHVTLKSKRAECCYT